MVIFLNGKFVSSAKAKVSVFDHGFLYGDGVFERLRTYKGKAWNVEAHVKRLCQSARLIKIHVPWNVKQIMRWTVSTVAKQKRSRDFNIRITLTRGMAAKDMRYDFISPRKPTICIMVSPFRPWPKEFYEKGLKVITVQKEREFPEIKTISLLPQVIANHKMHVVKANEAIFIAHDGRVTEGTSSNCYFVKNGILIFPDARVLGGTTMEIVKKLAKKLGIRVAKKVFLQKDIATCQESFVTSVTRGVMPVASIDRKYFQSPGSITRKLMKALSEYVEANT